MKALLVYPIHANGDEVAEDYRAAGIDAAAFPARVVEGYSNHRPNCWNSDADTAEAMGLSVIKTVCPSCHCKCVCQQRGYLGAIKLAQQAVVAVATHKRAEYTTLSELMQGRTYVSIHEDATSVLRPKCEISEGDLRQVCWAVARILTDPYFLKRFGTAAQSDDDGTPYGNEELKIRMDRQFEFLQHLLHVIETPMAAVDAATTNQEWVPSVARKVPRGLEQTLFWVTCQLKTSFEGHPWRFLLAAAAGELPTQAILVSKRPQRGARPGEVLLVKSVIGFRRNLPTRSATTWFNDATGRPEVLERLVGMPIQNHTPTGQLALQRKAVQVARDITRQTKPQVVQSLIRGILIDRPQSRRVGIITHRPHLVAIAGLELEFAKRITKITYFRSGEDRSSNAWHQECDLIIVAGTPRLPEQAVAEYLVQIGEVGAACRKAQSGRLLWEGLNESNETVRVEGKGYLDLDWRAAHRDLVRAALVQAVGRGRGILPDGCEVVVMSNEECGLRLSDAAAKPLNAVSQQLLDRLVSASAENAYKTHQTFSAVSTASLAQQIGLSVRQTRDLLRDLDRRGLITRVGDRGGWQLVRREASESAAAITPTPASTEGTGC